MWQVMRDDAKLADLFPWYTVKIATPVQTVERALMPIASIRYCQNVTHRGRSAQSPLTYAGYDVPVA